MFTDRPLLSLKNVHKTYRMGEEQIAVLRGIDLNVHQGEFLVIKGAPGCGKSALLNVMSGIEGVSRGDMNVAGLCCTGVRDRSLLEGLVAFLCPFFSLDASLTIQEALNQPGLRRHMAVSRALEMAGINPEDNRRIEELSHTTRRRVGVARAIVGRPQLILADMSPPPWGVAPPLDALLRANQTLRCAVVVTTTDDVHVQDAIHFDMEEGRLHTPTLA